MSAVVVTGSGGLVGSAVVRHFAGLGLTVVGLDNDMRGKLFGPDGSTAGLVESLRRDVPGYEHHHADVRDRAMLDALLADYGTDVSLVVHAASQPAHESADPLVDWDVDATGTVNVLEATRRHAPGAVVVFLSTIKVYGQWPNDLPLEERETRYEYAFTDPALGWDGIDESMSIDAGAHSVFGATKVAADILAQEYGHTLGVRTVILRPGCMTGPAHAGVRQHGFLAYLVRCVAQGIPYLVEGDGKQVRDQIHAADVVSAIEAIWRDPPEPGSVYNLGGGRGTEVSVLEALALAEQATGRTAVREHVPARHGDHRWWVTDMARFRARYPRWTPTRDLAAIMDELARRWQP